MKFVNLEQGSEPWLAWRRQKITATSPGIIMGLSPYSTPNQLWREMALGEERQVYKPAVEAGKLLEEPARLWTELYLCQKIEPSPCVESASNPRHAASLDGCIGLRKVGDDSWECDAVVEIKNPYTPQSYQSQITNPPVMYIAQVQWQLYVTQAPIGYLAFFNGQSGHVIDIKPDPSLVEDMLKAVKKFEAYLDNFEEPPLCDRDWAIEESADWLEIADMKKQSSERLKQAEYEDKVINAKLEQLAANRVRVKGGGISYSQSISRGKVKYSEVLKELGVEASLLDKYRGAPIVKTTIRVI